VHALIFHSCGPKNADPADDLLADRKGHRHVAALLQARHLDFVADPHVHAVIGDIQPDALQELLMRVEPIGMSGLVSLSWTAVPGAETYDLLAGDLSMLRVVDSVLSLGPVRVLARGIGQTYWSEEVDDFVPAPGRAIFYVAQYRDAEGAKGYGTASGPWPRAPGFCEGGCP